MLYGHTPFSEIKNTIRKCHAIINPNHKIQYPEDADPWAVDAVKSCLKRSPQDRLPIVASSSSQNDSGQLGGGIGLLCSHPFLHAK